VKAPTREASPRWQIETPGRQPAIGDIQAIGSTIQQEEVREPATVSMGKYPSKMDVGLLEAAPHHHLRSDSGNDLTAVRNPNTDKGGVRRPWRKTLLADILPIVALGVLLPAMVLTKTTALFLVPAVFWMLWGACGSAWAKFLRVAVPAVLLAATLWLGYFLLIVRPRFLEDYRYLFAANAYTGMTRETFVSVLAGALYDGRWIGMVVCPLAAAATILALSGGRRLADHPLIAALLLWIGGYLAFLAYHNNLQPRYYLVIAVPMTLLLPTVAEDIVLARLKGRRTRQLWLTLAGIAVAGIVIPDAIETIGFVRHPQYTLVHAARQVADYIARDRRLDPGHNPLILSISGSDISLITGLPSICDDFGTLQLIDRVRKYRPGWYVAWNQVEDDKMDALAPFFHLNRVAAFPAMDDPGRNLLILYRLDENSGPQPARHGTPPVPRRLRSKLGQQPSAAQMIH
jgi:hypothetical protein